MKFHFSSPKNKNIEEVFHYGLFQKIIIKFISLYMKFSVKKFLDFSYGDDIQFPSPKKDREYLLYLHIPFCKTLCSYCSFHRFEFNEIQAKTYFKSLRKEMQFCKDKGFNFSSLYVGGGTTTVLPKELVKTINLAKELFDIKNVSCEGDPLIDEATSNILFGHIDRLSVGIQTTNDGLLKKVRRYKKFGSSKSQLNNISKLVNKFPIINIDMIFNLPQQSKEILEDDLKKIMDIYPDQISIYPLMCSPSTKKQIEISLGSFNNDNEAMFYKIILSTLKEKYNQISSWAFSKKEKETFDEYVADYNEYIGLGSGSFSFIQNTLYINTFSLQEYAKLIKQGKSSIQRHKIYHDKDIIQYQLMLDLFSDNIDFAKYKNNFDIDLKQEYKYRFIFLRYLGILKKNSYHATPFGKYFFLTLMKEFYIGMDYVREKSRSNLTHKDEECS